MAVTRDRPDEQRLVDSEKRSPRNQKSSVPDATHPPRRARHTLLCGPG